jgi:tetratricopeptide (TPR) repeat protein
MFNHDELARRLDARFRLLTGGRGDVERHHTLRAAVDWSFDLLDIAEQDVFVGLSVFADGATLEAAEQVLVGEDAGIDVLDVLTSLVDKSLVQVDRDQTPTRFGMLETIRQYAQERLVARGDADQLRRRHAQYYASLARTIGRGLYSPEERAWDARLRDEIDDFQLAVSWATSAGETDWAMRIAGSFPRQGSQRPLLGTAHLAEQALHAPRADDHPLRARVFAEAAWAAIARGDESTATQLLLKSIAAQRAGARYAAAAFTYFLRYVGNAQILVLDDQTETVLPGVETPRQFIDEGLAMAAAANDTLGLAGLRSAAAILAFGEGDYDTASTLAEQALAEARALRQPTLEISALLAVGMVRAQSDPPEAISLLRQSLQLATDMGVEGDEQSSYGLLAELETRQGNLREALEALREVARVARAVPDTNAAPVFFIGGRAFIDAGRPDLVAVCEAQGRRSRFNYFDVYDEIHARDIADAKALLGEETFERHVREEENRPPELFAERMLNEIDALLESM